MWQGTSRRKIGWSPGAGDIYEAGGEPLTAWSDPTPAYDLIVKVTKSLSITGFGYGLDKSSYSLRCTHRLVRVDERDTLYTNATNQSQSTDLTRPIEIHPNDPSEIVRNFIGNDVARELAGEYKALLHQYKTKPV